MFIQVTEVGAPKLSSVAVESIICFRPAFKGDGDGGKMPHCVLDLMGYRQMAVIETYDDVACMIERAVDSDRDALARSLSGYISQLVLYTEER